jgi:hypothetical protein
MKKSDKKAVGSGRSNGFDGPGTGPGDGRGRNGGQGNGFAKAKTRGSSGVAGVGGVGGAPTLTDGAFSLIRGMKAGGKVNRGDGACMKGHTKGKMV